MATKLMHLAPPPAFDAESDKLSLAQRWKDWRERFDMYLLAANITDAKQKRALLLYVAGPQFISRFQHVNRYWHRLQNICGETR